ncbi:hypothetical protein Taro_010454 [Colocasia esculenta]|uniref:Uncharacterized protein n=1 Tax=Colocasia esculenta TaxID=4460 RepID=A0A843U3L9_COLES|nr:hypothetical protein [Colocasia esculenta]
MNVLPNDIDLLNPPAELEKRRHKFKRLVQSPNSFFMNDRVQPLPDGGGLRELPDHPVPADRGQGQAYGGMLLQEEGRLDGPSTLSIFTGMDRIRSGDRSGGSLTLDRLSQGMASTLGLRMQMGQHNHDQRGGDLTFKVYRMGYNADFYKIMWRPHISVPL